MMCCFMLCLQPKVDNGVGTQNNVVTINNEDCDIYQVLKSDSLGATYGRVLSAFLIKSVLQCKHQLSVITIL